MNHGNWLGPRKSSKKSLAKTESSGSLSSYSEKFSDDQASVDHNPQSLEVASKVVFSGEEHIDIVKNLTEKLSVAVLSIDAKEDLIKQHAKVAEEAVSGWEKAENEVLILKQQLEVGTKQNSVLEDRISNLDRALKEYVKQLRQAKEEREQKISETVAKKTREWECANSALEIQIVELRAQLQSAKTKAFVSIDSPELHSKLKIYGNALGNNSKAPCMELNLMDDFLEMEKLVTFPETESRNCLASSNHPSSEIVIHHVSEIEKLKIENEKLETDLSECHEQIKVSRRFLNESEIKVAELQSQLSLANELKNAVEEEVNCIHAKRETEELKLSIFEAEIKTLCYKIGSLEEEVENEKILSAKAVDKCRKLEEELSRFHLEARQHHVLAVKGELKIKQEKDLTAAATKLAECQQTIFSLSRQLKSLATREDFLADSNKPLDLDENSNNFKEGSEAWKMPSSYLSAPKNKTDKTVSDYSHPLNNVELMASQDLAIGAEKIRTGFGKLFSRSKGGKSNHI